MDDKTIRAAAESLWDKHPNNPKNKAAALIKQWDKSGQSKTSAYYRILGVALGRKSGK